MNQQGMASQDQLDDGNDLVSTFAMLSVSRTSPHLGVMAVDKALKSLEASLANEDLFIAFKKRLGLSLFGLAPEEPSAILIDASDSELSNWKQQWESYEDGLRAAGIDEIPQGELKKLVKALVSAGSLFSDNESALRNALQRSAALVADFVWFKSSGKDFPDAVIEPYSRYLYEKAAKHNHTDE